MEKAFLEEAKDILSPWILDAFGESLNQWGENNVWDVDPLKDFSSKNWGDVFYQAELIRRFEERCAQLYGMRKIWGFCHLYIGQEASAVGAYSAKKPQDSVITSYRDHGHVLAGGEDPRYVMAELCGKETGSSKGKGGSMHIFDPKRNFWGGHGIVGASSTLGTGLAFAHKYLGDDGVCLAFFGDGAVNQGQFFESANMAALWNLPVIYVVENNLYSMGTPLWRGCAGKGLYKRGEPFGIQGFKVNGMDFLQVRASFLWALHQARTFQRPVLLEVMTYRNRGHSMSDPGNYREKKEVEFLKKWDVLENIKNYAQKHGSLAEETIKDIKDRVKKIIKESVDFCENSGDPSPSLLTTDVYQKEC